MIETPFLKLLETLTPAFSNTLDHAKFRLPLKQVQAYMEFAPQATIVFIVGPSHVGKSLLLKYGVRHLSSKVFAGTAENLRPVFGASAMVSRDARTTPKYLYEELLFDLGNPFFDPLVTKFGPGRMDSNETTMLRSLRHGMLAMGARIVLVDEGDYLVRAKDQQFRSLLIESVKSLVTPLTTVFIVGGYDLLETVLQGRAHIATRKIVVDVQSYVDSTDDAREWRSIVSSMALSGHFSRKSASMLKASADRLRYESNGIIGVLEKRLITMLARAKANDSDIDQTVIDSSMPTDFEWNTIRQDVERGIEMMKHVGTDGEIADVSAIPGARGRRAPKRAFERSPKRQVTVPAP